MRQAYTLIELVVALGIFVVLMATVTVMLVTTLRGARKAAVVAVAKSQGQFAMNSISQLVKYSTRVVDCSNPTSLTVEKVNGHQVTYSLAGGQIASSSPVLTSTINLTSPEVSVTTTGCSGGNMFSCPGINTVNICFAVEGANASDVTTAVGALGTGGVRFESQIYLRNWSN